MSLNRVAVSVGGAFVALATALGAVRSAVLDPVAQAAEAGALPNGSDAGGALAQIVPAEIARIFTRIAQEAEPAHWMAVGVVERRTLDVGATHGAAGPVHTSAGRLADLDLRVGTPALDNTHKIRDAGWFDDEARPSLDLPLSDDVPWAIQTAIWRTADDAYRAAVRRLIKVRTNDVVKVSREDLSADFSTAPVAHYDQPGIPLVVDGEAWQQRVRAASKIFLEYPAVFDSNVSLRTQDDLDHVWTSEGTALTWRATRFASRRGVDRRGRRNAARGLRLRGRRTVEAMPSRASFEQMARSVATRDRLRTAPLSGPTSPVIRGTARGRGLLPRISATA